MNYFTFVAGILVIFCGEIKAQSCEAKGAEYRCRNVTITGSYTIAINVPLNKDIKTVKFVHSNLHSIPKEIFRSFDNLERVMLDRQKIKKNRSKLLHQSEKFERIKFE